MTHKITIYFSGLLPLVFNDATILVDDLSTLEFTTPIKPQGTSKFSKSVIAGYTLQELPPNP